MISVIFYIVMTVLFIFVFFGVGLSLLINRDGSITRLAIMFAAAVAVLFFGGAAVNYYLRTRDLFAGAVSHMDETAKLHKGQYKSSVGDTTETNLGTGWFVKLGSKDFRLLSKDQYVAFEEGVNYRVHYIKSYPIDVILSAEAI